jgi:Ca-activated chloride channel family protein
MTRRFYVGVMVVAAVASVAAHQQKPFTANVEAVRVDVLVSRGGQPVEGLTARDFQVRDEGVQQQVDHVAFEELPLNVVLALDASGSLTGPRERELRAASRRLLDGLKPVDQAALVRFGDAVTIRSELTKQIDGVRDALDEGVPKGETSLVDASYAAILLGEAQPGRALVIVFTDGVEVSSYLDTRTVIDIAKRSDAVVYGVALTIGGRPTFLQDLADATGGELLAVRANEDLGATFEKVLDQFRHRYVISYTPTGVARGGWHRLQVRVDRPGITVKARPGYTRE